jgi:hypothetical protein
MESNQIKFAENKDYTVTFKFDTPQTGTSQHGQWNRYGVEHEGMESSFFASPGLHNRITKYGVDDTITITKRMMNGKTSWDIKEVSKSNGVSKGIDSRTKDIHRQVCLKLAVESMGTVKKADDSYYDEIKNRLTQFSSILDPVDALIDKFDGEVVDGKELPF